MSDARQHGMGGDDDGAAATSCGSNGDEPTTELLERMEAALLTLPRFTREVFLAHRVDDLSYVEIAKITGVSVRRIERELARAIVGIHRGMTERQPRTKWWKQW